MRIGNTDYDPTTIGRISITETGEEYPISRVMHKDI